MPVPARTVAAIALLAITLSASTATRQLQKNVVRLADITIDRHTGDRLYNGRPFTGEAQQHDPNGTLLRVEQFANGRRHGLLGMWFRNGLPAFESTYHHGRREGMALSWWSNGQPRSETLFVNDLPHGIASSWYSSGERYKRYQYTMGVPTGLQQAWRKNGKLFTNFEYRNGRAYGLRNSNLCVELDDEKIVP